MELRGLEPLTSSMPWWPDKPRRRAASRDQVHERPCPAPFIKAGSPPLCPPIRIHHGEIDARHSRLVSSPREHPDASAVGFLSALSATLRQVGSCGCECASMGSGTSSPKAAGMRELFVDREVATTGWWSLRKTCRPPETRVNIVCQLHLSPSGCVAYGLHHASGTVTPYRSW